MENMTILKKALLFSELEEENLAEVAAISAKRVFSKGETSSVREKLPPVFICLHREA